MTNITSNEGEIAMKDKRCIEYLTEVASSFLEKEYGRKLAIPIKINKNLKRQLSRLKYDSSTNNYVLELSSILLEIADHEYVINVLKHQLVQHQTFLPSGRKLNFEDEVKRLGVIERVPDVKTNFLLQCYRCESTFETRIGWIANNSSLREAYSSPCCQAKYECIGEVIYKENERFELIKPAEDNTNEEDKEDVAS